MIALAACLVLAASTPAPPVCAPHVIPIARELHQVVPAARTHAWRT